jgi:N-acetylglutamate synthase-like GNAT family acetyltransferase
VEVRAARPEDVDELVALVESAYRGESSRAGWTTEADLLDGQRTDADEVQSMLPHLLVAQTDDGIIGCCALVPEARHGQFGMFAVRPGRQASGLGSALLREAEARARGLGLDLVEMTVLSLRTELIAFYERRGYRRTGERRPFPHHDERFGLPRRGDLEFEVLAKDL